MKTTIKNTPEAIMEYLNGLTNSELVSIHNEYCQANGYGDNEIYSSYEYGHDYVKFNGYANLVSFNDASGEIDLNAIAADIEENPENYYGIELEDIEEEEED